MQIEGKLERDQLLALIRGMAVTLRRLLNLPPRLKLTPKHAAPAAWRAHFFCPCRLFTLSVHALCRLQVMLRSADTKAAQIAKEKEAREKGGERGAAASELGDVGEWNRRTPRDAPLRRRHGLIV